MDSERAERFIRDLYAGVLRRAPGPEEFAHWVDIAMSGRALDEILGLFVASPEFSQKRRIEPKFHPGHYHSPITDPDVAFERAHRNREDIGAGPIAGIELDAAPMWKFLESAQPNIASAIFTDQATPTSRYYYDNGAFPYGDALVLRAMIQTLQPKRVVEIGSGFSTACMLDAADEVGLSDTHFTCIEPDPGRLLGLLRPTDADRVDLREEEVQDADLGLFEALDEDDILFIDSTHVLKTGSDVNWELFNILPIVRPGVIIHFHDIHYPFEYPDEWIRENYSWNEIYAVRAFLTGNDFYRVMFWNAMLAHLDRRRLQAISELLVRNPGGSLWIRKLGRGGG